MNGRWLVLVLAACEGNGGTAAPDAAGDVLPDAPQGADCPAPLTGTLVDLQDRAIAGATLRYDRDVSATTDEAGFFSMCPCLPVSGIPTELILDAPGDYLDGTIYFEYPMTYGHPIRTLRADEVSTLYTYDPTRAQVLVLEDVDGVPLTLGAQHDPAKQAYDSQPWQDGNGGRYVLFPNVDVSAPIVEIDETFSLEFAGPHYIDVAAGKVSLVVLQSAID